MESEVFLAYLDDDGEQKFSFVKLLSTDGGLVKFRTKEGNVIQLPLSRVLKIKSKGESYA